MGITKVTKRVSTVVEEIRHTCDYCGVVSDTEAMPQGWGMLRVKQADFTNGDATVCSKCIGNLGKTVVEVAAEKAMMLEVDIK